MNKIEIVETTSYEEKAVFGVIALDRATLLSWREVEEFFENHKNAQWLQLMLPGSIGPCLVIPGGALRKNNGEKP